MSALPPESNRLEEGHLPTPFSAEEIRLACAPGRRMVFEVTGAGVEDHLALWEFIAGDEVGAESIRWHESLHGSPLGEREVAVSRWIEFQGHASYPADRTTVQETTVDVGAGTFSAWLYERRDEGEVTKAWFAKDLPGPPVLLVAEREGKVVTRSELVESVDPR